MAADHGHILDLARVIAIKFVEPDHFCNVTNGIAYRRWLCQSNPELTALLKELIGDGFTKDSRELEKMAADHGHILDLARVIAIKFVEPGPQAAVDLLHNLVHPGQELLEQIHAPPLQGLAHDGATRS